MLSLIRQPTPVIIIHKCHRLQNIHANYTQNIHNLNQCEMTDSHILVASLLRSPVRYGMGDFMSLWVLALAGLKVGFEALVFIFMLSCCCLQNQLLCSGCFADFLAKESDRVVRLISSRCKLVCRRAES